MPDPISQAAAIVLVDERVESLQALLDELAFRGVVAYTVAAADNGFRKMADTLALGTQVRSVHVFAFQAQDKWSLGTSVLQAGMVGELAAIKNTLAAQADLVLYGSELAQGAAGSALMKELATTTGANVAAWTDVAGGIPVEGGWLLEAATGSLEATPLVTTAKPLTAHAFEGGDFNPERSALLARFAMNVYGEDQSGQISAQDALTKITPDLTDSTKGIYAPASTLADDGWGVFTGDTELQGLIADFSPANDPGFTANGYFTSLNAAAMVAVKDRTIVLVIRGSSSEYGPLDKIADFVQAALAEQAHAAQLDPLFQAFHAYVLSHKADFDNVWVTGHSLGGAMAEIFYQRYGADLASSTDFDFRVSTVGSPGTDMASSVASFSRLEHLGHTEDPVFSGLVGLGAYQYPGALYDVDLPFTQALVGFEEHANYDVTLPRLAASDVVQAMSGAGIRMTSPNHWLEPTRYAPGLRYVLLPDDPALAQPTWRFGNDWDLFDRNFVVLDGARGSSFNFDSARMVGVDGGGGNDTLSAASVLDYTVWLGGGTGDDQLRGGAKSDLLLGAAGSDTLSGGGGADVFRFDVADAGVDVIEDFTSGVDRIELSGAPTAATWSYGAGTLWLDPDGNAGTPDAFAVATFGAAVESLLPADVVITSGASTLHVGGGAFSVTESGPVAVDPVVGNLREAVTSLLGRLDQALRNNAFADLPVIGAGLQNAAQVRAIADLKAIFARVLQEIDDTRNYLENRIEQELNGAIAAAGLTQVHVDLTVGQDAGVALTVSGGVSENVEAGLPALTPVLQGLDLTLAGGARAAIAYDFHLTVGADGNGAYIGTAGTELTARVLLGGKIDAHAQLGFLQLDGHFGSTAPLVPGAEGLLLDGTFSLDLQDTDTDEKLYISVPIDPQPIPLQVSLQGRAGLDASLGLSAAGSALPGMSAGVSVDWSFAGSVTDPLGSLGAWSVPTVQIQNVSLVAYLRDALSGLLQHLENSLRAHAFVEQLPVIGPLTPNMEAAAKVLHDLRDAFIGALDEAASANDYLETSIEQKLNQALANAGFGGTLADLGVGNGDVSLRFDGGKTISFTQPIAAGLGLDGLALGLDGSASASLGYQFHFTVGADQDGAYVRTDGDELTVQAGIDVPLTAHAQLGFLNFDASIGNGGHVFGGNFVLDLKDVDATTTDEKLHLAQLPAAGTNPVEARLTGDANIDVALNLNMGSAALPSISTGLSIDWSFADSLLDPGDNNALGALPVVQFQNVKYDFGTFMDGFLEPILDKVEPVLRPIHEALAVLRTDISFLHPWISVLDVAGASAGGGDARDGKITLLDFAKLAWPQQNLSQAAQFMQLADDIIRWAEVMRGYDFGPDAYDLGSFTIGGDLRDAAVRLSDPAYDRSLAGRSLADFLATTGSMDAAGKQAALEMFSGNPAFAFPLLDNPQQLLNLFFGREADLFTLDLPAMGLRFGAIDANGTPTSLVKLASLPVWGPLPLIELKVEGAAEIAADMAFGYDTRGLRQFADNPIPEEAWRVLNGFYVSDQKSGGTDPAEAWIRAAIAVGIGAWAGLELTVNGNVSGQVEINLNDGVSGDPNDGKVYVDEMGKALIQNPFALFDASGAVSAGISAVASVDIWLIGRKEIWRYDSPRVTLASFDYRGGSVDAPPPAPGLAERDLGTLRLHIGAEAGKRTIGDKADGAESFQIQSGAGSVSVLAFGRAQVFSSITAIAGDGGELDDQILLDASLTLPAQLAGGGGSDYLYAADGADSLSGGAGRDNIRGLGGADTLDGGDGDDVLEGGAGADHVLGGAGVDLLSYGSSAAAITVDLASQSFSGGDAEGDVVTGVEAFEGTPLADRLSGLDTAGTDLFFGGAGNDTLLGRGGDDFLAGAEGSDSLIGGTGNDTLAGGEGSDVYEVDSADDVVDEDLAGPGGGIDRIVASLDWSLDTPARTDIEELQLAGAARRGTGNALDNLLLGTDGADTLDGGAGNDTLAGGAGDDTYHFDAPGDLVQEPDAAAGHDRVFLDSARFRLAGSEFDMNRAPGVEDLVVVAGAAGLILYGNALSNRIEGALDGQIIHGGAGDDSVSGASGRVSFDGGAGTDTLLLADFASAAGNVSYLGRAAEGAVLGATSSMADLDRHFAGGGSYVLRWDGLPGVGESIDLSAVERVEVLKTGAGNDLLAYHGGTAYAGGAGTDAFYAEWSGASAAITWDNADPGSPRTVNGVTVSGLERLLLRTGAGADRLVNTTAATDDEFVTGAGNDTVIAGAGNDRIDTGLGVNVADGGGGTDALTVDWSAATAPVTFFGRAAAGARLDAASTWDAVVTHFGDGHSYIVESGSDSVDATSIERLDMKTGAGDDLLIYQGGTVYDGGAGRDTFFADWSASASNLVWDTSLADSTLANGVTLSGMERLLLRTGTGHDRIDNFGGSGGDVIDSGAGDDTVVSGTGNDEIRTASGNDSVRSGEGNDTILAAEGQDSIEAGAGDDLIDAGTGGGVVDGGAGFDSVSIDMSDARSLVQYAVLVGSGLNLHIGSDFDAIHAYASTPSYGLGYRTAVYWVTLLTDMAILELANLERVESLRGGNYSDLLIYQGGSYYDGGAGTDTFYADFSSLASPIMWDNADPSQPVVIDGAVTVSGMERLLLTTGAGDDFLSNAASPPMTYFTPDRAMTPSAPARVTTRSIPAWATTTWTVAPGSTACPGWT